MLDVSFMERAIALARRSQPRAGVNPPVGAVLVRDGKILGEGYHQGPGSPHAEAAALLDAREKSADHTGYFPGATLYCSLEPCCHSGGGKRTPPCTEAIIAAGISRVVFASHDPNPRVCGKGAERLRQAGIIVEPGLLAEEANDLIASFSVSIALKRPFVHLKWAQSLDGQVACRGGASRWITNDEARARAHELRASHDAVMVGAGTLRADDPELTVRHVVVDPERGMRQPLHVVCAGRSPLRMDARLFSADLRDRALVLAAASSPAAAQCKCAGIPVIVLEPGSDGLLDVGDCLRALYAHGIGSVLVEGGSALLTSFLASGAWDALSVFLAPLVLGQGIGAIGDLGIPSPDRGIRLEGARFHVSDGFVRLDARNPSGGKAARVGAREGSCSQD